MFLESVIRFYKRLVKDKDFRSQLESAANSSECKKMMQEAGYEFTQEEFETATVQILEKKGLRDLDDSFSELSEQELELAFGGVWLSYWDWKPLTYEDVQKDVQIDIDFRKDLKSNPNFQISIIPNLAVAEYGVVFPPGTTLEPVTFADVYSTQLTTA